MTLSVEFLDLLKDNFSSKQQIANNYGIVRSAVVNIEVKEDMIWSPTQECC